MPKVSDPTVAFLGDQDASFDAAAFEQSNVHSVYESIATHFSDTRYKPWPLIPAFIESLPSGAIGADLGCGNGKYLAIRSVLAGVDPARDTLTLGLDRSANLIGLARSNFASVTQGHKTGSQDGARWNEVVVGDALSSGYRTACFDYAISVATIHHFATLERRIQAVQELIRIVRPSAADEATAKGLTQESGGNPKYHSLARRSSRFLIVVWALEQRGESRRRFEQVGQKGDTLNNDPTDDRQDLLVPWILKDKADGSANEAQTNFAERQDTRPVFQRYYHVFKEGELEDLVRHASQRFPDIEVRHELGGWEKGNWFGIWQCIRR